jgi:WD40 repeat protein
MKHISILSCTLFLLAVLIPACGQKSESIPAVPAKSTQQIVTTPSPTEPSSTSSETISGHPVLTSSNANALTLLARIGKGMVRQIAYSPEGKDLAVATSIGMFVYSIDTLEEVNSHETNDIVWSIAFSPDGKMVAAGLNDNTILLWDWQGDQISLILGDEYKYNAVSTVAFSPDGSLIAGGYLSGGVAIWNAADGSRLRTLMADTPRIETKSIAFSPDGRFLATGSGDAKTRLWDVSSGTLKFSFGEAENSVSSVAFSPDGTILASASFSWDSTIRLWKTSDGSMIRAFKGNSLTYSSLSFSPDGRYLSAIGNDGNVEIWRLADDSMVKLPASSSGFAIFSPDSTTLAVVSAITVEFWNVDLKRLAGSIETFWAGANCISFSPDSRLLAAGYKDGRVRLWSSNDKSLVRTLSTQTSSVESIAYSPDGTLLAIGATNGEVQLWDPVVGILKSALNYDLYHLNPEVFHFHLPSLAFSPDGTILAVGSDRLYLWKVR